FASHADYHNLHSFPTRRSSDLEGIQLRSERAGAGGHGVLQRLQDGLPEVLSDACDSDKFDGTERPPLPCLKATKRMRRSVLQVRSEEHTSELQSLAYLVCRLLL